MQGGVLPWRRNASAGIDILLITSRGGNRWIIPKGWPMPGMTLRESASQEAFEEAGVRGETAMTPIGRFRTEKADLFGRIRELEVKVYAMEVSEELVDWPEKAERQRRWLGAAEAADAVDSATLGALIRSFRPGIDGGA